MPPEDVVSLREGMTSSSMAPGTRGMVNLICLLGFLETGLNAEGRDYPTY